MENQNNTEKQYIHTLSNISDFSENTRVPKSDLLLFFISILISGVVFGSVGYYLGKNSSNLPLGNSDSVVSAGFSTTTTSESTRTIVDSDSVVGWETYVNEKYGYAIKYPKVDQEFGKFDSYTDELIMINGLDNLLVRIEPIVDTGISSLEWWNNQEIESYSNKPNACFTQKTATEIKSLYDPEKTVVKFENEVFIVDNLFGDQGFSENCLEPPQVRIVIISTNKGLLKLTYTWAGEAERILSTFTLL
jgi:hypothetical protein